MITQGPLNHSVSKEVSHFHGYPGLTCVTKRLSNTGTNHTRNEVKCQNIQVLFRISTYLSIKKILNTKNKQLSKIFFRDLNY